MTVQTKPHTLRQQVAAFVQELDPGNPKTVRLEPLGQGHHNLIYLCQNGPRNYPEKFAVRCPKHPGHGQLEAEYRQLRFLDGRQAPRAFCLDRLSGIDMPVMLEEYIEGTHKEFNELKPAEIETLARAVGRIHAITSGQFSPGAGLLPSHQGTYADYLRAMVQESVTGRLQAVDMVSYTAAQPLITAGLRQLFELLDATSEPFSGQIFSLLHHDLTPDNVLWRPDGKVIFIDWNATFGDPADDLDYIVTNNRTSVAFKPIFLAAYQPSSSLVARLKAYTLKNQLDDLAWAITMRERYPRDPVYKASYDQRLATLERVLS